MPVSDPMPLRHLARPRPVSHARLDGEPPRLQPLAPGNEERHEPKRPAPRRSEPADRVRDPDARTQRDPRRRETVPRPAGHQCRAVAPAHAVRRPAVRSYRTQHGAHRASPGNLRPPVAGAGLHLHRHEPRQRVRSGDQHRGVPHRPFRRRRVRPVAAPAPPPARGGAGDRPRRAPRQLSIDAEPAGLGGDLGGRQLHRRTAGQRQAQDRAPQQAEDPPRRLRARPADPRRLLRATARAGVLRRRPQRLRRRGAGKIRPQAQGGPGGAAVQRPRHPPGRHRHHRHRARLRRPGADRRRRPTRRGPTVRDPRLRTVDGLARRPGQRSGGTLAALADQHVHRRSGQSLSPPAATRTRRRNGKIDRAPRVCGLFHRKHCP
ncbi:transcriptional regulator MexT [Pseudomonas aeruginosa NCMG1179]|nr:transcriptional regulator MexT [Pseudomonas aeruginosa NCMG1179]